jgi:GT2 family glycosyltransferase
LSTTSIIIPTYNRAEILRHTLVELTRQSLPTEEYEVIVADDGSSDHTAEVVKSFEGQLRIAYHFQEDLGFRAGAARNAGARLATGDVLVFLDTGTLPGPDFVRAHRDAHKPDLPRGAAVVGYVYGYRHEDPPPGLNEAIERDHPEEIRAAYGDLPAFCDMRHEHFASFDFQLDRMAVPCLVFFTTNCSVRAEEFFAAGGFDEGYHGWGMEDVDLGLRLMHRGLPFRLTREAWAIETPHERDLAANHENNLRNAVYLMEKYKFSEPLFEMVLIAFMNEVLLELEGYYQTVLDLADANRDNNVCDELEKVAAQVPDGSRVAVFGCGPEVPASLRDAVLVDYDRTMLERANADNRHETLNNIGIRTSLADDSVDTVVITSRLDGFREHWGDLIEQEANRVGRQVLRA